MSLLASTLVPQRTTPLTSFGNEPFYITVGKALFVFVLLVVLTLLTIWAERRVVARMQQRLGPNRVGPGGVLQGLADGIKLALKEDIIPALADRPVYILAPLISAIPAFLAFSVIPFGPTVSINGNDVPLQLTDLPVGVLFVLAMSSIGVYGIILAGWSSGSVYPLLGSLRSAAQVISYEVALGLSLVAVFLYAGSLSTSEIVEAQDSRWFVLVVPVSFVIYAISAVGEVNRAPFDLPEAESELVGGFHTEYSSLKFAMFFLAEYINMITVIAVAVTLFFGGWKPMYPFSHFEFFSTGYFPIVTFVSKVVVGIFFFIWLRGTLPRLRYDQFMDLGWKVLVPVSLVWILLIATVRTLDTQVTDARTLYIYVGGAIAIALVALAFWPQKKEQPEAVPDPDAHALGDLVTGGYPVPSLPLVHSNPATGPGRALGLTPAQPPAEAGTGPEETTSV